MLKFIHFANFIHTFTVYCTYAFIVGDGNLPPAFYNKGNSHAYVCGK